eukprot:gnl/MRDRNA2_/MRDRNA2_56045_c0_seq1.p1 gnl/MRDRNA2_/MRDRNA2_56045_c0~~gnl/MRDRNA2_/MRDRNA2_56045_c0_seq1.p1  ORF type:complete len:107 (-),score=3.85 gnl/MRDRNA2_/MRDRNA2_56045_c0_seq1:209-529(-)
MPVCLAVSVARASSCRVACLCLPGRPTPLHLCARFGCSLHVHTRSSIHPKLLFLSAASSLALLAALQAQACFNHFFFGRRKGIEPYHLVLPSCLKLLIKEGWQDSS